MINSFIEICTRRYKVTLLLLIMIVAVGLSYYYNLAKEETPEVKIPMVFVSVHYEGVSPEDGERMILRPLEQYLKTVNGLKKMTSYAITSNSSVILEFNAGFDTDTALSNVRDKVSEAKAKLPNAADEPKITEIDFSAFPVLNIILSGDLPEAALIKIARNLRDEIELLPDVLKVNVVGNKKDILEIGIRPEKLEYYGLSKNAIGAIAGNNQLVTAGNIKDKHGEFAIKIPGLLETVQDVSDVPIKVKDRAVVKFTDIGTLRRTFEDSKNIARSNGKKAIVLEVSKRTGRNIIETISKVKETVSRQQQFLPSNLDITYARDSSKRIQDQITSLTNSVILTVILVMIVIILSIGIRQGIFVALSVPISFCFGIIIIAAYGCTMNMVVLFALILSVGMVVDDSIIVVEYANRRMIDGISYRQAYLDAAKRMVLPIISSTLTVIVVFLPLLFWPGVVGQFMKYLPITLINVLNGSLIFAIFFLPALGKLYGKDKVISDHEKEFIHASESGDLKIIKGFSGKYLKLLEKTLNRPKTFIAMIVFFLFCTIQLYGFIGKGVEFFPDIEPDNTQIVIRARGNLSLQEKDKIAKTIEQKVTYLKDEVDIFYTKVGEMDASNKTFPNDTIALIDMSFSDWKTRRKANEIMNEINQRLKDTPGIVIDVQKENKGPQAGKAIQIEVSSKITGNLDKTADKIYGYLKADKDYVNLEDSRPSSRIEWQLKFNKELAAKYGINVSSFGAFVQMITNRGLKISSYRPEDTDDEVDIILRFPSKERSLEQIGRLKVINDNKQAIPISNFVTIIPKAEVQQIDRVDSFKTITIKTDVLPGIVANNKIKEISKWLEAQNFDKNIRIKFAGSNEDQEITQKFLQNAFLIALFMIVLILMIQFDSLYYTFVIMSAIVLSINGVLLALIITGRPFGIVMCGVGIIALAGIVVKNNIIFMDTYNTLHQAGMDKREAIMRTGVQRLKPILLTSVTAVLGLIPLIMGLDLDFIHREITLGSPSSQWWTQLSTTIAGGLTFATIMTLFLTPCMLLIAKEKK